MKFGCLYTRVEVKNIIIVGYPKSGTTWVARLVSELVDCPLIGDWGFEDVDAPFKLKEKENSGFQCFKAHHTAKELGHAVEKKIYKTIYVVRDPRDVVVSGMHYFRFLPSGVQFLRGRRLIGLGPVLRGVFRKMVSVSEKKKRMIRAVLNGDLKVNKWFRVSWKEHLKGYEDQGAFIVRYEDLLNTPEVECRKITNHLGLEISEERIKEAVMNQSFDVQKEKAEDNTYMYKLLRSGTSGSWKSVLTDSEQELFRKEIGTQNNFYDFA